MNKINQVKTTKTYNKAPLTRGLAAKQTGGSLKGKNGITLIALVITIVLMLILATITVNVVIDGGLFSYAGKAKQETEIASEKDSLQKAVVLAKTTSKTGRVTTEELQTAINKVGSESSATAIDDGDRIVVKFNASNRYYEINSKGNVEGPIEIIFDTTPGELDGTGTEDAPFIIMSIEDLVYFSKQVNEGENTYNGKYVVLGKTLDFNLDLSYIDPNTTEYDEYLGGDGTTGLKEQLTNGMGFRPIGENGKHYFAGKFDGNNNSIKNIKIEIDGLGGLFGYIRGGSEESPRVIKNLTISGNITATSYAGGIIGEASYYYVALENLVNYANVTSSGNSAGGVVGRSFDSSGTMNFDKCINYGNITSKGATGGIVGEGYGRNIKIMNTANYGRLENLSQESYCGTGGIMGGGYNPNVKIYNSCNCGNLLGGSRVGGIYGHSATNVITNVLANVFNVGETEKYGWTPGGLAGQDSRFANVINAYYISTYQYGIGWGSVIAGTQYAEEQMKALDFVNELNTNIENGCPYEQENDDGTTETVTIDTTGWAKWVYNENSYPTLDLSTTWNGTEWVKK